MSRGGHRNPGHPQSNSTTGIAGVFFGFDGNRPRIQVVVGAKRYSRGTTVLGQREAMRQALELREQAGYPVPELGYALRALRAWLRG
jgi:hypothetical protein